MISLFGSAVNIDSWEYFMDSLKNNDVEYEVVFAGPNEPDKDYDNLRYIKTNNIKPAQCYQVAGMHCSGDVIGLTCDDVIYPDGFLDGINDIFDDNDGDIVVGFDIMERGGLCKYESYTMGDDPEGYIMCSLGFFSKKLFNDLKGFDKNFITGQYENDFFMRCHSLGVKFIKYKEKYPEICHDPNSRFSLYHDHGRSLNKSMWFTDRWQLNRKSEFEPYEDENILQVSQGPRGEWK